MEREANESQPTAETVTVDPHGVLRTLLRAAVVIALLGALVSALKLEQGYYQQDDDLGARFELHTEGSLAVWFSTIVLLLSAPPLLLLARRAKAGGWRRDALAWAGLAVVVTLMSIDELASFHEYTAVVVDHDILGFYEGYNWLVFGIVFVVAFVVLYTPFVWRLPEPLRRRLVIGALVFFGGAVAMEAFNANTASTVGDVNYRYLLGTAVEELLEMCGPIIVLFALFDHLRTSRVAVELRLGRRRRPEG